MHECNPGATAPGPRLVIDEPHPFVTQMLEGHFDIEHGVGDMVQALTATVQELPDGRVRCQRLQELDMRSSDGDHRLFDALGLNYLAVGRGDPVLPIIFGERLVEIVHGNADVVNVEEKHAARLGTPDGERPSNPVGQSSRRA